MTINGDELRIVRVLARKRKMTWHQLAKRLGMSPGPSAVAALYDRTRRLRKSGLVKRSFMGGKYWLTRDGRAALG